LLACAVALAAGCQKDEVKRPEPATAFEADTLDEFQRRANAYVDLRKKLEDGLPALPTEATPEQIDTRQRELGRRLAAARANAAQGDLITLPMQTVIRTRFAAIFTRDTPGQDTRGSVMDENPVGMPLHVNQRYPDEVPLSTMPPEVLEFLPKLPDDLEFRFVGRHLIIMDTPAHLIADFVPDAIPE
jgi:hypothetical protein